VWKWCDFGTAKNDGDKTSDRRKGTKQYLAPEVISNIPREYSAKSDVYAFAIFMTDVLIQADNQEYTSWSTSIASHKFLANVEDHQLRPFTSTPENLPGVVSNFIKKCWSTDPQTRPTTSELCEFLAQQT